MVKAMKLKNRTCSQNPLSKIVAKIEGTANSVSANTNIARELGKLWSL